MQLRQTLNPIALPLAGRHRWKNVSKETYVSFRLFGWYQPHQVGKTVNTRMPERPVKVEHYLFGVRLGYIAGGVGWGDEVGTEHNYK